VVHDIEPLLPKETSFIIFPSEIALIAFMIRFPVHFTSTRLSFQSSTGIILKVVFPISLGRSQGSVPILVDPVPLEYFLDAVRNPAYHSGSYQSITGLLVGT